MTMQYTRMIQRHWVKDPVLSSVAPLKKYSGLQATSIRSMALLQLLEREYKPSLSRDGELLAVLEAIKQKHFGMQRGGLGGLLGSLFQNLSSDPAIASA